MYLTGFFFSFVWEGREKEEQCNCFPQPLVAHHGNISSHNWWVVILMRSKMVKKSGVNFSCVGVQVGCEVGAGVA